MHETPERKAGLVLPFPGSPSEAARPRRRLNVLACASEQRAGPGSRNRCFLNSALSSIFSIQSVTRLRAGVTPFPVPASISNSRLGGANCFPPGVPSSILLYPCLVILPRTSFASLRLPAGGPAALAVLAPVSPGDAHSRPRSAGVIRLKPRQGYGVARLQSPRHR